LKQKSSLKKVTGIDITYAETSFDLGANTSSKNLTLIQDVFVTCLVGRDRVYTLIFNLDLYNPFKAIEVHYRFRNPSTGEHETGSFRIRLENSSFLVQLIQRINYDECLSVQHVQLSPNIAYEIDCLGCNEFQQQYLDKIFDKRMTQFDMELDSMLNEKLLLGLKGLLDQRRLELDLHLS